MKRLSIPEAECIVAMTRGVVDMLTVVNPEHRRCAEQSIKYSKQKWQAFWEYFERTSIDGYALEIWNMHGMANEPVARTNNPLERFNRELNTRFPTPHPSMATFVTTINKISAEYVQQLADIPRGRARRILVIGLPVPVDLSEVLENTVEVEAKSHAEQVTASSATDTTNENSVVQL
ncbi:LOW QUALITY PROTEIN: hypothetical protein PHPALM_31553 [Phytophthora palmivora]|uniref:Uncharacterized protein n=1 Tax=Phytophthora palmivora TaxID=4796 RepID=A0A2P4X296_9STRA|nr:LOW QUALITY PROTEIN: hypothetical protein PHPALM_31553 [Phytophthora palmivora]